ncbi:MAG: proteasome assembly chaperone family protein [Thermoplasmata archaeon]|nr:proteasome assembly chaperone family protein [Thermoplasmata archaeon]
MREFEFKMYELPELNSPILVEGLPGVGNVGKLAAEHLIEQVDAKLFAEIFSVDFPPQVTVGEKGLISEVKNSLYYKRFPKKDNDLIILVGDYQGLTHQSQYRFAWSMIELARELDVERIFTLGGYGVGRLVDSPRVLGASSDPMMIDELKELGVIFNEGEPGSGIVGASGLLLGIGKLFGIYGACLMGETSGYFVDPNSAKAVLKVLTSYLEIEINFEELEDKARRVEEITEQIKSVEKQFSNEPSQEDLKYFG